MNAQNGPGGRSHRSIFFVIKRYYILFFVNVIVSSKEVLLMSIINIYKGVNYMKKNIRTVLLGELLLFVLVFFFVILLSSYELSSAMWFLDLPSLILILIILIPGLLIMGEWKDFVKSFSVGIKDFRLLELKNIIEAVDAAQKLTIFGALFAIIMSAILLLGHLSNPETIGPNLAVCFLAGFYAVIIEFFLLPLRLNAERKMNEEMDLGDE